MDDDNREKPPNEPESDSPHVDEVGEADFQTSRNIVVLPPEAVREAAERGEPLSVEVRAVSVRTAGPLPPPAMLREYDDVYPGLTKIIVDEFQAETLHRRGLQNVGQRGALFVVALSIIAGGGLGLIASDWRLTLAITAPICSAVGIAQFIEFG